LSLIHNGNWCIASLMALKQPVLQSLQDLTFAARRARHSEVLEDKFKKIKSVKTWVKNVGARNPIVLQSVQKTPKERSLTRSRFSRENYEALARLDGKEKLGER